MHQVMPFLLIVLGVTAVNGLKCHECSNGAECSQDTLGNCTGAYCFKTMSSGQEQEVKKGCLDNAINGIGCTKLEKTSDSSLTVVHCACDTDFCNSSNIFRSSLLAILLLAVFMMAV